jgi:iron complex transport system substrate-binding protein
LHAVQANQVKNRVRYALGFSLERNSDFTFITVYNPWKHGDTLATYFLIKNKSKISHPAKSDFIIEVPVHRVASLSSTFLGMFNLLGESDRISACTDPQLIVDSLLYNRYLDGNLFDLGGAMQTNAEAIVGHFPDLLMKYIYGGGDLIDQKIIEAGIPIAYNLEYMETNPLGRAEWLKFVAAFVCKEEIGDSLFESMEKSYIELSKLAVNSKTKPTVLDGSSYQGVWHAAGGRSYPAKLYADAGADYYWKNDSSRGNIPLSFEVVLDKQANSDYWIGPSIGSKDELLGIENRYSLLKPFRTGNVFHFEKRINPHGGLDYYESGVVHPDVLLKDLIWVFHSELLDRAYKPIYLERVK